MRIIICGAGQVGWQIARQLSGERNDIVLIDLDEETIRQANDALDVQGVLGNAAHPDVLEEAGAADADLMIAATTSDEVNIVACEIGRALFQVPRRIARLGATVYNDPRYAELYSANNLAVDVVINPEAEIAQATLGRLAAPATFDTETFMDGRVRLLGLALTADCPVLQTPLRQLSELFAGLRAVVVGIRRGQRLFSPEPNDQLMAEDRIYVVAATDDVGRTLDLFGRRETAARRIILIGGGRVAVAVAQGLEAKGDISVKLIERDAARAEAAADMLDRAIVLNGDGLSGDLLAEAGVSACDAVVTLTQDDRTNILAAVRAKQAGARLAIALVNDPTMIPLAASLGIDAQISPRAATVSSILRHVRRGRVRDVYSLGDAEAEMIEAQVLAGSALAGTAIRDLALPRGALVAAVEKDGAILRPRPDMRLDQGDLVLIFALSGDIEEVERLLQVSADWF